MGCCGVYKTEALEVQSYLIQCFTLKTKSTLVIRKTGLEARLVPQNPTT